MGGLSDFFDHFPQQEATSTASEQPHPEAFLLQNKNTGEGYELGQTVHTDGRAAERHVKHPHSTFISHVTAFRLAFLCEST